MTARAGMTNLIRRLRAMTNAGTADFTAGADTYWADVHLQEILDSVRVDLNRLPLRANPEYLGGTALYHDYYAPYGNLEEADSGTVAWQVEDADGDDAGTANYTADYINGIVRFSADQSGTAYYLRGRSYNLNQAAALIWRHRASSVAAYYSFKADDQSFNQSEWYDHCMALAREFEKEGGIAFRRLTRSDLTS